MNSKNVRKDSRKHYHESVDDGFFGNLIPYHITIHSFSVVVWMENFDILFRMPNDLVCRPFIQMGNEVVKYISERMFVFVISKKFIAYPHRTCIYSLEVVSITRACKNSATKGKKK